MNPLVQTQTASKWQEMRRVHRFEHQAMATLFEIYLSHLDSEYAAQAAFTCFAEIDRLEQELSRFIPNSDVSRINHLKAGDEVTVGLDTFYCLNMAEQIYGWRIG
jgi:thiamine biosynthesis lipoprotein